MPSLRLLALTAMLSFAGCAAAPDGDMGDEEDTGEDDDRASDAGTKRDGGRTTNMTIVRDGATSTGTSSNGSSSSVDLGGILGGIVGDGAAKPPAGDGGMCSDLICFDVFDCAIFHPDALSCGFTACVGFKCVK